MIRLAPGRAVAVWFVLVSWCSSSQCHAGHREIVRHSDQGFHPSLHLGSTDDGRGLNLLVVGDWGRDGYYNQSQVAEKMGAVAEEIGAAFVISSGDNFYENGLTGVDDAAFDTSFSNVYKVPGLVDKPWHIVLGNHDYRGDVLAQLDPALIARDARWHCERAFVLRYLLAGSLDYVDFVFYDTNPFIEKYWEDTEHTYDWRGIEPRDQFIENELEFLSSWLSSSNATWKIVIGHHPIYSVGHHGNTVELIDEVYPILKERNVDVYINGHDHCLEHITRSGIEFLTSGAGSKAWRGIDTEADMTGLQFYYDGQGFMSMSISQTALSFQFYDVFGNALHGKSINKTSTAS